MCLKKIANWYNKGLRRLNMWDIALVKTSIFCFGLLVGAYFASYILPYMWLVLVIMVLAEIKPVYKALK